MLHESLNATKTESLIIESRPNILKLKKQTGVKQSFELEEQKILMVNDIKLLGVEIDDKLLLIYEVTRLSKSKQRRYKLFVLISMPKSFFLQVICRKCIEELLSRISAIVA